MNNRNNLLEGKRRNITTIRMRGETITRYEQATNDMNIKFMMIPSSWSGDKSSLYNLFIEIHQKMMIKGHLQQTKKWNIRNREINLIDNIDFTMNYKIYHETYLGINITYFQLISYPKHDVRIYQYVQKWLW